VLDTSSCVVVCAGVMVVIAMLDDLIEFRLVIDATEDDFLNINEESICKEFVCTFVKENKGFISA
jgi:hypothetical protein